jgi:ribokinase
MKNIDMVAIGDIVTDAFIRLKDAEVLDTHEINHTEKKLCVRFGDKVPYDSVTVVRAVGNSANAAVSAARLGITASLMATVGDDEEGKKDFEELKANHVLLDHMEVDKNLPTNYHYVLWYGVERTILVKHAPYERHLPKDFVAPKWIYLSSLGENTEAFHHEISAWLKDHPETKLAFQPGTFQIKLGKEKLADIYSATEIFFCNKEEAIKILGVDQSQNILELSRGIADLGPKIVSISDGPNGAYLYADNELWSVPIYPDIAPPVDRTGAGDAFASTIVAGIALGLSPVQALSWGPINSMSVVQEIGAQKGLLSREKLEEYLAKAPAEYKPTKIN